MPDQVIDFSTLDTVEFNGTDLTEVIYNGTTIWEKLVFEREFVIIGDAGNSADSQTGYGSVIYNYSIAKTAEPLVSMKLYNADPANVSNAISVFNYTYNINDNANNLKPIINLSFYDACHYVNWLNTSEGEQPAYKFNGNVLAEWTSAEAWQAGGENIWRHKDAKYFIPSRNEWYKAAYSKGSNNPSDYFTYATASNTAPTAVGSGTAANTAVWAQGTNGIPADVDKCGGLSPYGTMGQSGNVHEWSDFNVGYNPLVRLNQGGWWKSSTSPRISKNYFTISTDLDGSLNADGSHGLRVATAPVGTGAQPDDLQSPIRCNVTERTGWSEVQNTGADFSSANQIKNLLPAVVYRDWDGSTPIDPNNPPTSVNTSDPWKTIWSINWTVTMNSGGSKLKKVCANRLYFGEIDEDFYDEYQKMFLIGSDSSIIYAWINTDGEYYVYPTNTNQLPISLNNTSGRVHVDTYIRQTLNVVYAKILVQVEGTPTADD